MTKLKNKSAFTLIELLVVIAIIGILSTLAVVALQNARKSARDAKRIADGKQIQTALELYFNDNGSYPASITSTIATGGQVYMEVYPTAPTPADGSCSTTTNAYAYSSDGATYSINFCLGSQTAGLPAGTKQASASGIINYTPPPPPFVCGEIFTDPRDSQQYPTVLIGTQCWMAKNMNYDDGCALNTWANNTESRWCGCQGNISGNCTTYGKLYQWNAAMAGATTEGVQGICPTGWHLPTSAEFTTLNNTIDANPSYRCGGTSGAIGKALASVSGWASYATVCTVGNSQETNNSSAFNSLPASNRITTGFNDLGYAGYFWSSSGSKTSTAVSRRVHYGSTNFLEVSYSPIFSLSVRCVLNN